MDQGQSSENILGCHVSTDPIGTIINLIDKRLDGEKKEQMFVVCANPHSLVEAANDPAFHKAIHDADLVAPDGAGIVFASKILGGSISERVTGSDIFRQLSISLNEKGGMRYFFLGSTETTLQSIREKLTADYPNIAFAGSFSPPYKAEFSEEDSREMIAAVNKAKADVLWVGLTAPKQEKWIHQYRDQLNVKFIGAIGAVFDFYVGNVKRPNPALQKMGLEWLTRLLQEPRRLFKRNFVSSPLFLFRVFRQKFQK